uniref:Uncharacterized protein n=1 Tax=Dromaius novaehollandiae TaxID=8790 RepID=A0A8C4J8N4_DRONO
PATSLCSMLIPLSFYLFCQGLNAAVFPSVPDGWRNKDTITFPEIYIKMNIQTEIELKPKEKNPQQPC